MGITGVGITRRRALGAGATLGGLSAAAGCGLFDDDPDPAPEPDPLQPILDEALSLASAYDRVSATDPALAARLTPMAADHRTHAAELARVIGVPTAPSAGPSAGAPADGVSDLRKAVQAAQRTATAAARTARADRAGLVASIAACRASHAEALK